MRRRTRSIRVRLLRVTHIPGSSHPTSWKEALNFPCKAADFARHAMQAGEPALNNTDRQAAKLQFVPVDALSIELALEFDEVATSFA